jgi:hypothetical protein
VPEAHACNPNYSGGRDQQERGSKLAWANSLWDPMSKKPITKKGWWSGSRYRSWVQIPVLQSNNSNKNTEWVRSCFTPTRKAMIIVAIVMILSQ